MGFEGACVGEWRPFWVPGSYPAQRTSNSLLVIALGHVRIEPVGLFQQLGAPAEFYVPHRLEEGYGLNVEALRQLAAGGVRVVVTVDCGIASLEEADAAREFGIELIVTDHHEMKDRLPAACCVQA